METDLAVILQQMPHSSVKLFIFVQVFLTEFKTLHSAWVSDQLAVLCLGAYPSHFSSKVLDLYLGKLCVKSITYSSSQFWGSPSRRSFSGSRRFIISTETSAAGRPLCGAFSSDFLS